jgi:hypothetical protein
MKRRMTRADQRAIERQRRGAPRIETPKGKPGPKPDPNRAPKRSDRRWQTIQAEQLEREPYCRICAGAGKRVKADEVDHVQALANGGIFADPANLQSLCRPCHYQKTEDENARRAGRRPRKVRERVTIDPATGLPLPGQAHWWSDPEG